jgi:hypothetical protein
VASLPLVRETKKPGKTQKIQIENTEIVPRRLGEIISGDLDGFMRD